MALETLTRRLEELSATLHRAGIPAERLLELASVATLQAAALELMRSDEPPAAAAEPEQLPERRAA